MSEKSILHKIVAYFKKYWTIYLFYLGLLWHLGNVLNVTKFNPYSFLYVALSFTLFTIARINLKIKIVRYICAFLNYAIFFYCMSQQGLTAVQLRTATFNSFVLYAYMLPDPFTPFLILGLFWLKVLTILDKLPQHMIRSLFIGAATQSIGYIAAFTFFRMITKEKEQYKEMSITDSLTGTFTLDYIIEIGNGLLKKGKEITLVVIDLDNFKQLNDNFGHLVGNNILKEIGDLLIQKTEESRGKIGRIGGDEFVILLNDEQHIDVKQFVNKLYDSMHEQEYEVDPDIEKIRLSFSFGICHSAALGKGNMMDKLLYNADVDMYYNKYNNRSVPVNLKSTQVFLPPRITQYLTVMAEKDMYTYVHSEHVARYAASLAQQIGLPWEKVVDIYIAGWLHDIGKSLISNNILRKTGGLSVDEYNTIKEHIGIGMNIINKLEISEVIENGIKYHHEHWDGSGYPFSKEGEDIPIEGRILKIVDSYSAMCIKRVYRQPLSIKEALAEIKRHKGTHFDPYLVEQFSKSLESKEKKSVIKSIDNWIAEQKYTLELLDN